MTTTSTDADRTGTCADCGEQTPVDGEQGGIRAGRILCDECSRRKVVYVAECVDCDWEYVHEDTAFNWHAAKQRVQQEGNNHEQEKRVFEDESHETGWRRVEDLSAEVVARAH